MRVLDLFSGIGGFSLGLERAGMTTVAFCEIDPFCRQVLKKHWPDVPIYEDVTKLSKEQLDADGIGVDLICGGFPCQDISEAGHRTGIEGARSGLWKQYARLVGEIRPSYIIVENVSELLVSAIGVVLGDLAEIGYDCEWHSIPAANIGADHLRERIWIIAYPTLARTAQSELCGRQQCQAQVGKDAAQDYADPDGTRLAWGLSPVTIGEDARNISAWLGLAISSAPPFPPINRTCSPVLGRNENGIPGRVDRIKSLGNAVVPQIPELIGRAIMAAQYTP